MSLHTFTFTRNPVCFIKTLARKTEGEDERFPVLHVPPTFREHERNLTIQGLSCIAAPSTTALSHRKPASAETSRDSWRVQVSDKINALYNKYFFVIR